jgi:hypothetical protein
MEWQSNVNTIMIYFEQMSHYELLKKYFFCRFSYTIKIYVKAQMLNDKFCTYIIFKIFVLGYICILTCNF